MATDGTDKPRKVAIIGFGEVGRIFAEDLHKAGIPIIAVYDIQFGNPNSDPSGVVSRYPVTEAKSAVDAVKDADFVFASVTASNTKEAAASVAPGIAKGAFYLDINSASPGMKWEASELINAANGRYVEAAVMTAVPPHRIGSAMLLGGPHAEAFLAMATPLGFKAQVYDPVNVGVASSVKMCRSVMIKGLEALATECLMTARKLGVEKDVLASLGETIPAPDMEKFFRYLITRSLQHGKRRAEEMREVARTVAEAGVEPRLASATAIRQDENYVLGREIELNQPLMEIVDAMREAQDHVAKHKAAE